MTVKCLGPQSQQEICRSFLMDKRTLNELTNSWGVSRRTIVRILEDAKIDPGVKHRTPKLNPEQIVIPMQPGLITHFPGQTTSLDDDLPQETWVKRFFKTLKRGWGAHL